MEISDPREHGMTEYERVIRLRDKPRIPPDLADSATEMDSYLTQLRQDSIKHEKIRLRVGRTQQTRIRKSLEAASRKITIEPSTGSDTSKQQQTMIKRCKKIPLTEAASVTEPREGSLVTEQRKGVVVLCPNCTHRFVHYSKNLSRQYYCSCGKCHANIRLRHYTHA